MRIGRDEYYYSEVDYGEDYEDGEYGDEYYYEENGDYYEGGGKGNGCVLINYVIINQNYFLSYYAEGPSRGDQSLSTGGGSASTATGDDAI